MNRGWWIRAIALLALALLLLLAVRLHSAAAQTIDPHRLYEQKCSGCHEPHAGDFAKAALRVQVGAVVAK